MAAGSTRSRRPTRSPRSPAHPCGPTGCPSPRCPRGAGSAAAPRRRTLASRTRPSPPRGPAVPAGHGRLGLALVEEDEPVRVDRPHPLAPLLPLGDQFGVELLLGPHRLFFRVM